MPVHDWSRVDDGAFHQFHQDVIPQLVRRLNGGLLPGPLYAATERKLRTAGEDDPLSAAPDVLAVADAGGGVAAGAVRSVSSAVPLLTYQDRVAATDYAKLADRIAIRTTDGDELVAVFELVSAGNKSSRQRLRLFVNKCIRLVHGGVHVTLVDLHPPTRRDPYGLHPVIWAEFADAPQRPPADKPFTVAAYSAGATPRAYVEPVGVGDSLPDTPLFVSPRRYVPLPLEAVYMDCWAAYPNRWKRLIEPPADA